ncbi:MAG: hypothetical protein M3O50_07515 [Myxococcota bacterium]|nr:hypothetical protein [Myxococcota bacterium]
MISPELRARIRRLFFAEHWKMGTIAAELGVHRDTVALAVECERFTNVAYRPRPLCSRPDARELPALPSRGLPRVPRRPAWTSL